MIRFFHFWLLALFIIHAGCDRNDAITITIYPEVTGHIDNRLFGQFLEKPSWGNEFGIESAVVPGTHKLQEGVYERMDSMNIPVLRFPGGTDVDHLDWTDMIDHAPGREKTGRPVSTGHTGVKITNFFGYDEALEVSEKLGAEMILVVNFGEGYYGEKPLSEAANHAAALVAYCNSSIGEDQPGDLKIWPEIRKKNGRTEPYKVRYFQIANEPWVLDERLKNRRLIDSSVKEHYFDCIDAYITAMKDVDPDIEIILDGNSEGLTDELKENFGDRIDYAAYHAYHPWQISEIIKNKTIMDSISDEEVWKAWVALPRFNDGGFSILDSASFAPAKRSGYPVAVTEWNWNGWWSERYRNKGILNSDWAKGVGAAGILHALMRKGSEIVMACQSMVVGNAWGITGIRVDPEAKAPPYYLPTGQVTALYSTYHGTELYQVSGINIPFYRQPYKMNGIEPSEKVAVLDYLATGDGEFIYLHVINRDYNEDHEIKIALDKFNVDPITGTHFLLEGTIDNSSFRENENEVADLSSKQFDLSKKNGYLRIPKRSVNVIRIKK